MFLLQNNSSLCSLKFKYNLSLLWVFCRLSIECLIFETSFSHQTVHLNGYVNVTDENDLPTAVIFFSANEVLDIPSDVTHYDYGKHE